MSLLGAAALIEILGGAFIVLGLFTRLAAFIASGEMVVAYFMGPRGARSSVALPGRQRRRTASAVQLRSDPHPAPDALGDAGAQGDVRPFSQTTPSPSPSRMNGYAG